MRHLLMLPLILATACAAKAPPGDQSEPTLGGCDAAKAQFAVGKIADAALIAKVKAAAGGQAVRRIKPGQMVTMDYSDGRLNLTLDGSGKVTKVTCG